jgi:hypothetical protein
MISERDNKYVDQVSPASNCFRGPYLPFKMLNRRDTVYFHFSSDQTSIQVVINGQESVSS